jgi:hypothetical protein
VTHTHNAVKTAFVFSTHHNHLCVSESVYDPSSSTTLPFSSQFSPCRRSAVQRPGQKREGSAVHYYIHPTTPSSFRREGFRCSAIAAFHPLPSWNSRALALHSSTTAPTKAKRFSRYGPYHAKTPTAFPFPYACYYPRFLPRWIRGPAQPRKASSAFRRV